MSDFYISIPVRDSPETINNLWKVESSYSNIQLRDGNRGVNSSWEIVLEVKTKGAKSIINHPLSFRYSASNKITPDSQIQLLFDLDN